MATIFHVALASDWAAAQETGAYTTSTRGRTLAEEGFIHASRGDQWPGIRAAFYGDLPAEALVLLQIDTTLLDVPVVEEPAAPGATETFPHLYGPLRVDAVVRALPIPGAPARPATPPTPPGAPTETFARLYFHEMFFNLGLVCMVMLSAAAGVALGGLAGGDAGPGTGGLVGVVAGLALAVLLYRRRHAGRNG